MLILVAADPEPGRGGQRGLAARQRPATCGSACRRACLPTGSARASPLPAETPSAQHYFWPLYTVSGGAGHPARADPVAGLRGRRGHRVLRDGAGPGGARRVHRPAPDPGQLPAGVGRPARPGPRTRRRRAAGRGRPAARLAADRRGDVPDLPGLPGRPAGLLPGRPAPAPPRPDLAGGAGRARRGDPAGGRDPAAADPSRVPDRAEPQPGRGQARHLPAPQHAGAVPLARRPGDQRGRSRRPGGCGGHWLADPPVRAARRHHVLLRRVRHGHAPARRGRSRRLSPWPRTSSAPGPSSRPA